MLKSFKVKKKEQVSPSQSRTRRGQPLTALYPFSNQISFENDAFKLAEQMQAEEDAAGEGSDEELYFDQMTPEEQAAFDQSLKEKEQGAKDPDPPPVEKQETRDSLLEAAYESDEDDESVAEDDGHITFCWRRATDGILLVPDEGIVDGLPIDQFVLEESGDYRHNTMQKKPMSSLSKMWGMSMKKPRGSKVEYSQSNTTVKAEDMRMTSEQRVAVMTMVRDNAMTVDEAVEFVIQQEAQLASSRRLRKASTVPPTESAKVTPLAELIELMDKYTEEELPQHEKFNIMRDVRDGKKDVRVAMRTVKAIRRRSLQANRPPRPGKPPRPTPPKERPSRPSLSTPDGKPARPAGPVRPPRPSPKTGDPGTGDAPAAGGPAATRSRPPRPHLAGDERSPDDHGTDNTEPLEPVSETTTGPSSVDPYGSGEDRDDDSSAPPAAAEITEDASESPQPGTKESAGMSDAEREARYAAMTTSAEDDERAGKSKIWKALNPQRLWDDGHDSDKTVVTSGVSGGDESADVDDAVENAQAALDAIQAFEDDVGEEFADLSASEDEDEEDDGDDHIVDDGELMQMIEAKRKERELESEKRAQELRDKHAAEKAEEDARLEKERLAIAQAKEAERQAADAKKAQIHEEAQERLEAELSFDFKFKRNSTLSQNSQA